MLLGGTYDMGRGEIGAPGRIWLVTFSPTDWIRSLKVPQRLDTYKLPLDYQQEEQQNA